MPDIRSILSPEAVATLAAGYDDATFRAANQMAVQGLYPPLAVLTDPVLDAFWPAPGAPAALLAPKSRELAIVAALAASNGSSGNLAIHFYVALAVGATVDELAGVLGVVGSYAGVSRLMDGLTVLETTLGVLAAQVAKGEAGLMAVVPALKGTFPLSVTPPPASPTVAAPNAPIAPSVPAPKAKAPRGKTPKGADAAPRNGAGAPS